MDLSRIDHLVRSDLAVSTKVLQLVNSAFFGLPLMKSLVGWRLIISIHCSVRKGTHGWGKLRC